MQHHVEIVHPYCCGLDVHKKSISACILTPQGKYRRKFGTMTEDILAMVDWLKEHSVPIVAMESTGVYWKPVYNILESAEINAQVVNAQHIKMVPGRKTDVNDAEWIATLLRIGLLKPSFIPSRYERELRDLVRYRTCLVQERSRQIQRIQKILEASNIKIGSLISDITNISGRAMIEAIVQGKLKPEEIAALGNSKLKHTPEEYAKALRGSVGYLHQKLLAMQLIHIDELADRIAEIDAELNKVVKNNPNFERALELLDSIPGIAYHTAMAILVETGLDMSRFPTPKHLAAWAGVAPGNNESAGKKKNGKTRKGNAHLKAVIVQAAHSLCRKKDCHLAEQYRRFKNKKGSKKAALAVAHSILRIVFFLLVRQEMYKELGANYLSERNKMDRIRRHVKELAKLGLTIPKEIVDSQLANSA